jgi:DNA polymerase III subunit gamma/tau
MSATRNPTKPFDAIRPNTFSQIVGSQTVVRRITCMLAKERLPNVLFLTGPTGSGKTTLARIVARAKLCTDRPPREFEPCGSCENCRKPLNDTTCGVWDYQEWDANSVTEMTLDDFKFDFLRDGIVIFVDELQDLQSRYLKRLRKMIEGVTATLIFTTSHPDEIEDAFRNRLKSYEYEMKRPMPDEVADFLERRFQQLGIEHTSRSQLLRIAEALNCEMRPCGEFPQKVFAETDASLTDEYLDNLFGAEGRQAAPERGRRRRVI